MTDVREVAGLDAAQARELTELTISARDIDPAKPVTSLTGFGALPQLRRLEVWGLGLESLDLTGADALEELVASDNALTRIDLTATPRLTSLAIGRNPLGTIDLRPVRELRELRCDSNGLTELDLSAVPELRDLRCFGNRLTSLDLTAVPELRRLHCEDNLLTELDLSVLPHLEHAGYSGNPITPVTVKLGRAGTFSSLCGADFERTRRIDGRNVLITVATSDPAVVEGLRDTVSRAMGALTDLTTQARLLLAGSHPDDDTGIPLASIAFRTDGSVQLGFDAGESPAGELEIGVVFDRDLQRDSELVYEVY
ncbi:leucine-rich repeat domain-containing protein [Microbacterium gorillae]|uniref:leucine-rich repeat domain-containing protein n=1 Tax=Microbacterium gorillae TaxID=1231063 RepID=UPI003D995397